MTGTAIELESFHRIVQSWRTSQFTEDDPDSQIEVTFDPSILRSSERASRFAARMLLTITSVTRVVGGSRTTLIR
jgi:hypothetical protein